MKRITGRSNVKLPMSFLSRFTPTWKSQRPDTVSFVDSRGLALDLRDSLSSASEQNHELRERVREVWRECKTERGGFPANFKQGPKTAIYCKDFRWDLDGEKVQEKVRRNQLEGLCIDLGALASDPNGHFENLNERLSEHLLCIFKSDISEEVIVDRTCQILERLPRTALKVDFHNHGAASSQAVWPKEYLIASSHEAVAAEHRLVPSKTPWEELKVVSLMSTSVITLALQIVTARVGAHNVGWAMQTRLNLISELLDHVEASSASGNGLSGYGKYVLLAYLWTDWQRSMMLLMYHVLGNELIHGHDNAWTDVLALRGNSVLGRASARATLDGSSNPMSKYVCPWAFELLKTSRSSLGLDFRVFHKRFAIAHGNQPARCLFGSGEPCDGSHPLACGRFVDKRLVAAEQSMHDYTCSKQCDRVVWDETSYRSISGARAVSLSRNPRSITYCKASEHTMAVSHVWSHGQGGRPGTGINRCLHDRYCRIAKRQGCNSYWIDTVCIPEAHDLRKEAISYINEIFSNSKITLVCDKDLMNIDLSAAAWDVEVSESVISTFLICDWNVRAWTLLEAYRANHALHLLCKNNEMVSLRETLARVYLQGSIDLAVLSLATRHLLPMSSDAFRNAQYRRSVEYGGSLLSHRHASRDGDDIIIWTLLSDLQISDTAETMWKHRIKYRIKTGYLMTRTERVQNVRGFSWAPSSPYVRRSSHVSGDPTDSRFLSFDGEGSELGLVTAKGLRAIWLVYDVDGTDIKSHDDNPASMISKDDNGAYSTENIRGHHTQNVCWQTAISLRASQKWVRLLQPKSSNGAEPYRAAKDRGETHGPLIAICTADNYDVEDMRWHWNGVYEWPRSVSLPQFILDDMLLV